MSDARVLNLFRFLTEALRLQVKPVKNYSSYNGGGQQFLKLDDVSNLGGVLFTANREGNAFEYETLLKMSLSLRSYPDALEVVAAHSTVRTKDVRRHLLVADVDIAIDSAEGVARVLQTGQPKLEQDVLSMIGVTDAGVVRVLSEVVSEGTRSIFPGDEMADAVDAAEISLKRLEIDHDLSPDPAIIVRNRSRSAFVDAFESISEQLEEGMASSNMMPLVEPAGFDKDRSSPSKALDISPLSDDQRRMVDRGLSGVNMVVQGPPGTGKTHTIANLMTQLLADGKRVLVTASTSQALTEVRDKLPQALHGLCIPMIDRSRTSTDAASAVVTGILDNAATADPVDLDSQLDVLTERVQCATKEADTARSLSLAMDFARENGIDIEDEEFTAGDAIDWYLERREEFSWVPHFAFLWDGIAEVLGDRDSIERFIESLPDVYDLEYLEGLNDRRAVIDTVLSIRDDMKWILDADWNTVHDAIDLCSTLAHSSFPSVKRRIGHSNSIIQAATIAADYEGNASSLKVKDGELKAGLFARGIKNSLDVLNDAFQFNTAPAFAQIALIKSAYDSASRLVSSELAGVLNLIDQIGAGPASVTISRWLQGAKSFKDVYPHDSPSGALLKINAEKEASAKYEEILADGCQDFLAWLDKDDELIVDKLASLDDAVKFSRVNYDLQWMIKAGDSNGVIGREGKAIDHARDISTQLAARQAWSHATSSERMTGGVRARLNQYIYLSRKLGKGTGKHAARVRSEIRMALSGCVEGVPAWVMPIDRVCEEFSLRPGMFDVVIVDEASQMGVEGALLHYIADQVIAVGDDRQVSPSAIGVDHSQLDSLSWDMIPDDPYRATWADPGRSFFDEAVMRYGERIVLTEHRRCMPQIIGFSSRVAYEPNGVKLKAVRTDSTGLKPLVGVHIEGGFPDKKNINEKEVDRIVCEVKRIAESAEYEGMTVGVISLLGSAQADAISDRLADLGSDVIERLQLKVGDSASFQGAERDVILLSLVAGVNPEAPKAPSGLTHERYVQRFNVAVSRAKEQVILFHSATLDDLKNRDCMRRKLVEYVYEEHPEPESETVGWDFLDKLAEGCSM